MKNKWLPPRTRIFQKTRLRRREETTGGGSLLKPAPHVHGYVLGASSPLGETSRRIVLRLALFGVLMLKAIGTAI